MVCHNLCFDLICICLYKLCDALISILVYGDMIHNFKTGFLTHGLDLADHLADKALLNQFRSQIGIQDNGHIIVLFRYIAVLLCHVDQQVILCKNNLLAVKIKGQCAGFI